VEGTLALVALAAVAGADIVRVHDVREMSRAVRMIGALRESDS
jgi:dihydropteroate synthase